MQKAPPLQHFLSCSYAGLAAQAHGLGKRVLSNEYIHSGGSGMSQSGNWGLAVWPHELKNAPSCNRIAVGSDICSGYLDRPICCGLTTSVKYWFPWQESSRRYRWLYGFGSGFRRSDDSEPAQRDTELLPFLRRGCVGRIRTPSLRICVCSRRRQSSVRDWRCTCRSGRHVPDQGTHWTQRQTGNFRNDQSKITDLRFQSGRDWF